ncbi:hypothetical protein Tco_1203057 [Tanacetum coccineum]
MAIEVPQTLEYRYGQLNVALLLEVEISQIGKRGSCATSLDDLILYHGGLSDVKESRVMDLKLCYNTFKFKEDESVTQTFTRYKALMNELVNDGIKLLKLEINIGFINGLPKKWLAFCQSLRNTNHVKESELASLFGKLKYKENLIDNIYETNKEKTLVSTTPLSTAFISTSIVQDFKDSLDDEKDVRSSQDYVNDLEEEYQARSLLAKSKRFFKKDEEEVSSDRETEVKALMALAEEERVSFSKECARNGERVQISIRKLLEAKGFILPNHDTSRILPAESQRNSTDPPVVVIDSSETEYDSAKELSVCSTFFLPLEKAGDAEAVSGLKAIKTTLKSISTFKPKALKGIIPNEPSSAPSQENKKASALKTNPALVENSKNVKSTDYLHLDTVIKELNDLKLQVSKNQSSQTRDKQVS